MRKETALDLASDQLCQMKIKTMITRLEVPKRTKNEETVVKSQSILGLIKLVFVTVYFDPIYTTYVIAKNTIMKNSTLTHNVKQSLVEDV